MDVYHYISIVPVHTILILNNYRQFVNNTISDVAKMTSETKQENKSNHTLLNSFEKKL